MSEYKRFFKKGNGAAWIGLSFIILVFFLIIFLMNYFNWYDAMIQTQTKTDAMADAMGVAVNDGTGVQNVREMERVRDEMIGRLNDTSTTKIIRSSVKYDTDLLYGDENSNYDRLLDLSLKTRTPFLNASYFKRSRYDHSLDYSIFTGKNTTKIMIDPTSERNRRFPEDVLLACDPLYTYDRSQANYHTSNRYIDPELYRKIVVQFQVDRTDRYFADGNNTKESLYLWDVTRALGCELPYYFRTSDGAPWQVETTGKLVDTGNTPYIMQNVSDDYSSALEFFRKHVISLRDGPYASYSDKCPTPYYDYHNWQYHDVLNTQDGWQYIQSQANNGSPTILLFDNGQVWIVVPEVISSDCSRGLYVSYASSVPEYAQSTLASNAYVNNCALGYRQPNGNFKAISFGISEPIPNPNPDTIYY